MLPVSILMCRDLRVSHARRSTLSFLHPQSGGATLCTLMPVCKPYFPKNCNRLSQPRVATDGQPERRDSACYAHSREGLSSAGRGTRTSGDGRFCASESQEDHIDTATSTGCNGGLRGVLVSESCPDKSGRTELASAATVRVSRAALMTISGQIIGYHMSTIQNEEHDGTV